MKKTVMHDWRMTALNGHARAKTDTYYLHMRPAERSIRELPLGSEWSSEDPNAVTYVSTARTIFATRIADVRERLETHGIAIEGPLVPSDEHAAKKSQQDTWVLHIPQGKEVEAGHVTRTIGHIVGPVRKEAVNTMEPTPLNNKHTTNGRKNDLPAAITERMRRVPVEAETA